MAWLSVQYVPCLFWKISKGLLIDESLLQLNALGRGSPEKDPLSSGIHAATPAPSGSLWSSTRSNSPRRALLSSNPLRWILRSAARLYFFSCFSSLLFHLSCLLSILFLLLSSSLTSSLHCLLPAVTGMLKVAKMLRMQRKCALTFYSTNYPAKEMFWNQHRSVLFKMQ